MECALLFSLCLLWSVSTFDDVNGGVVVKEDSDAVLPCSLRTKENLEKELFVWTKDRKEVFMYDGGDYYGYGLSGQDKQFEGRVSHFEYELKNGNASIKITKTKVSDSGLYTCEFPRLRQEFLIELVVDCILKDRTKEEPGACPKPSVTILDQSMDWSLLQCKVKGASPRPEVEWRDSSGNILHAKEPQVTERGGSYDIILNTTVTKTDHYSCVLTQDEFCHQISSNIFVNIHVSDSIVGWIVVVAAAAAAVIVTLSVFILLAALFITDREVSGFSAGWIFVVAVVAAVIVTLMVVVVFILAALFATGHISCREVSDSIFGWIFVVAVVTLMVVVVFIQAVLVATGHISCREGSIVGWIAAVIVTLMVVVVIVLVALFATGCISCREGFLMKMCRHDDMKNNGDVTSHHLEVRVMMQPRSDGKELNEDVTSDLLEETDHMYEGHPGKESD